MDIKNLCNELRKTRSPYNIESRTSRNNSPQRSQTIKIPHVYFEKSSEVKQEAPQYLKTLKHERIQNTVKNLQAPCKLSICKLQLPHVFRRSETNKNTSPIVSSRIPTLILRNGSIEPINPYKQMILADNILDSSSKAKKKFTIPAKYKKLINNLNRILKSRS